MKSKIFATLLLVGFKASTSYGQATVDPELRAAFAVNPVAEVVVTFNGSGAPQASQLSVLQGLGIINGITFRALPIAGVLATAAQVDALAQNPQVRSIFFNKKLDFYNFEDTNLTGVRRLRRDSQMTSRNNGTPVSGRGIGVLINDSGVDGTHDDIKLGAHLVQNVLGSTNLNSKSPMLPVTFVEGVPNTDTNSGHGSHCAGIVGGNGSRSSGKYEGVAPGANLLGYGSGGALLVLDAIGGFDYALTHQFQYNIRVISNSYGSSGAFDPNSPINVASKRCYDRNMVVVFAAGNSGPGADTHNPYAIAPWTISVGAGDRFGLLAGFSSRGVKGQSGTFKVDGKSFTFKNEPVIVAPGVDVVSTRAIAPVASLGAQIDAAVLTPAELPFYTHISGTSMATPHVAGVVALILEANKSLTPDDVKALLQKTATNMPGRQSWEVGAGYVNAFAAVDQAFRSTAAYGTTVNNSARVFNSSVNSMSKATPFTIDFNPALTAGNSKFFVVGPGVNSLEVKISSPGFMGETGNPTNLVLVDPTGARRSSGTSLLFTISPDRSVAVTSPMPGTWQLVVEGLRGVAAPETIKGNITQETGSGTTNLKDVVGNPAAAAIQMAVSKRLMDGLTTGFGPDQPLTRIQLADYLLMGQGIRQFLPLNGVNSFVDVTGSDVLLTEAVSVKGAAQRDRLHVLDGVMLPTSAGTFSPTAVVDRTSVAYSLVQSLGFQQNALARAGKAITVNFNGQSIPVDDAAGIPDNLKGYVSIALELKLINAFFSITQGPTDLQPVVRATFNPKQTVTRGEYAVIATRTFPQYDALTQPVAVRGDASTTTLLAQSTKAYPNPFTGSTTIAYSLAQDGPVTVEVYNTMGRKVRTLVVGAETAGDHEVKFDAGDLARGTYLFKVKTAKSVSTKRLVLQ